MVPASMFMYGSILMAVTLKPSVLRSRPVDEAVGDSGGELQLEVARRRGATRGRTDDALADARDDTAGHEDVLHLGAAEERVS